MLSTTGGEAVGATSAGMLIISATVAHSNQIIPIVRYWIPHIKVISPEELQLEIEKSLNEYLGHGD